MTGQSEWAWTRGRDVGARRRTLIGLAAAVLGLAWVAVPAQGQAPAPSNCSAYPVDSPRACSGRPLDARDPAPARADPLVATTVRLFDGVVGKPYRETRLVSGGTAPYRVTGGDAPDGLSLRPDGVLVGTPQMDQETSFRLTIQDSSTPPQEIDQRYVLHVRPPPAPPRLRRDVVQPKPEIKAKAPVPQKVDKLDEGRLTVYRLTAEDLKAALKAPPGAASAKDGATPPTVGTTPAKGTAATTAGTAPDTAGLQKNALPFLDAEYPTVELFRSALAFRLGADLAPDLRERIVAAARKPIAFADAPPFHWSTEPGCRCRPQPARDSKIVYGVFPFWRATAEGPSLAFTRFTRIGVLGAQLGKDGSWLLPPDPAPNRDWWQALSPFARAAQDHGTKLDLILKRDDWTFLDNLEGPDRQAFYTNTARGAASLIDRSQDQPLAHRALLGFWNDPVHAFDGLTIMFTPPPPTATPEQLAAYHEFYDGFMRELIRVLAANKRSYSLTIVAPDFLATAADNVLPAPPADAKAERKAVAATDARGAVVASAPPTTLRAMQTEFLQDFLAYKKMAEPPTNRPGATEAERAAYVGTTDISLRLLVPLPEPTSVSKKALLETITYTDRVRGYDRLVVLNSVVPILFKPAGPVPGGKPAPQRLTQAEGRQLDDDLTFFNQVFGGVALWPAPMQHAGVGDEIYPRLERVFPSGQFADALSLCSLWLRLAWQAAIPLAVIAWLSYAIWGEGARLRLVFLGATLVITFLAIGLTAALWSVDPTWSEVRRGNVPLIVLGVIAACVGIWIWRKPSIPQP